MKMSGGGERVDVLWTDFIGYIFELMLFLSVVTNYQDPGEWAVM